MINLNPNPEIAATASLDEPAEMAVIGAAILFEDARDEIVRAAPLENFRGSQTCAAFKIISTLHHDFHPFDAASLEAAGLSPSFLAACIAKVSSPATGISAAHVLASLARRRALANAADQFRLAAQDPDDFSATLRVDAAIASLNGSSGRPPLPSAISAKSLALQFPEMREILIDGLLRRGEVMNLVSASKAQKSWLAMALALSVAAGKSFLGKSVTEGKVLYLDNELHPETSSFRLKTVAHALGVSPDSLDADFHMIHLRGHSLNIFDLPRVLQHAGFRDSKIDLIVLDALYRFFPPDCNESDNADMTRLYNQIDAIAAIHDAACLVVHHSSKGSQAEKRTTDVGRGAGAIAGAADTHLILREHETPDCFVVSTVARSFPPTPDFVIGWQFPTFRIEFGADAAALKKPAGSKSKLKSPDRSVTKITPEYFAKKFITPTPTGIFGIIANAARPPDMIAERESRSLIRQILDLGLAFSWKNRDSRLLISSVSQSTIKIYSTEKETFDKNPGHSADIIAAALGISRRSLYRKINPEIQEK